MRLWKPKVVLKVILTMLVAIAVCSTLLLARQNQVIESGAAGAGLGFGWVFFVYARIISGATAVLVLLLLLLLKWK